MSGAVSGVGVSSWCVGSVSGGVGSVGGGGVSSSKSVLAPSLCTPVVSSCPPIVSVCTPVVDGSPILISFWNAGSTSPPHQMVECQRRCPLRVSR